MKRFTLALALCISTFLGGTALAKPSQAEMLDRLIAIAEPDQVEAFEQLDLSPQQVQQLQQAAAQMMPRVEQMKGSPAGTFMLVPEALAKVDSILTPAQRPLARRLVPRAHQWAQLRTLYQDYRN